MTKIPHEGKQLSDKYSKNEIDVQKKDMERSPKVLMNVQQAIPLFSPLMMQAINSVWPLK